MNKHSLLRFAVLASVIAGVSVHAQELVFDINQTGPMNPSSQPRQSLSIGSRALFVATTDFSGTEPWSTDGTPSGTRLLLDVSPGVAGSAPEGFLELDTDWAIFHADGHSGRELYVTDGTSSGTSLLADINPGTGDAIASDPVLFQGAVYFFANDGTAGVELWQTDGTREGTRLFHEFFPGAQGSFNVGIPGRLAVAGSHLFAILRNPDSPGWGLYSSDGTSAGTEYLSELTTSGFDTIDHFSSLGETLIFGAPSAAFGYELWISDGTKLGTRVIDVNPGGADSQPKDFVVLGGHAYFAATHFVYGRELFRTDGTAAGTGLFVDIEPETFPLFSSSAPDLLGVVGGSLYVTAATLANGRQLYVSDGTLLGSHVVDSPVQLGNGLYDESGVALGSNEMLFVGYYGSVPDELWRTDGTAAGTMPITDVNPAPEGAFSSGLAKLNSGQVVFAAKDGFIGLEPWVTDGTVGGESSLGDLAQAQYNYGSEPLSLTEVGQRVFFSAIGDSSGRELWVSDGTSAGTSMVRDIRPGGSGSSPALGADVNGKLVFWADDGLTGLEPWVSDGTEAGTIPLADLYAGSFNSNWTFPEHALVGGLLYFTAFDALYGLELFATDGTPSGTTLVLDTIPGGASGLLEGLRAVGTDLYFAQRDTSFELSHWRFDTLTGLAEPLGDTNPTGSDTNGEVSWSSIPAGVLFGANDGVNGIELWIDPAGAGASQLLLDIWPGAVGSDVADFTELGDLALFTAANGLGGRDLWSSDGTAAGTMLLVTNESFIRSDWLVARDLAFIWAIDIVGRDSLYVTDGTPAGTQVVLSSSLQSSFSTVLRQIGSGNLVAFQNLAAGVGGETWVSDGTIAGTRLIADSFVGTGGTFPVGFARATNGTLFAGYWPNSGRELMRFELTELGGHVAETFGIGCAGSSGLAPKLSVLGEPLASTTFGVSVSDGAPFAPGFLFYGFERADVSFAGCAIYPWLSIPALPIYCDGAGVTQLPVTLSPDLAGRSIYVQAFLVDPGGALLGLASSSAGLEIVVGN